MDKETLGEEPFTTLSSTSLCWGGAWSAARELTQDVPVPAQAKPLESAGGPAEWGLSVLPVSREGNYCFSLKKVFLSIPGGIDKIGGAAFSLSWPAGGI